MHDYIISLKVDIWADKTSHFLLKCMHQARKVSGHVPSQESERSCIYVLEVPSQESEWSCIYVLEVPSQESERSCIYVSKVPSQEVSGHVFMC